VVTPREWVTTALDLVGLVSVAAGSAAAVFPWLGWACLVVAGVVVLGGSALAARVGSRPAGRES